MKGFADYNPMAITVYFLSVSIIAMFSMNPVILIFSLIGSVFLFLFQREKQSAKTHLFSAFLFLIMAVINPFVSHNGVTVLFVMNNNPITLEALVYGIFAAAMIVSVLYWFRSFSNIMTSEKLLYIFGALSPKLSLVLSMALRYIPLFKIQIKKINNAQKAMGIYKDNNISDGIKAGLRVGSVMITWALENGIITADSMEARGYGVGKRSRFSAFTFGCGDIFLMTASGVLFFVTLIGLREGTFVYYPAIIPPESGFSLYIGYAAYFLLALLPSAINLKESLKWKFLRSKI